MYTSGSFRFIGLGSLERFEGTDLYLYQFAGKPMAVEELEVLKQILNTNEKTQAEIVTPVLERGTSGKIYFRLQDEEDRNKAEVGETEPLVQLTSRGLEVWRWFNPREEFNLMFKLNLEKK